MSDIYLLQMRHLYRLARIALLATCAVLPSPAQQPAPAFAISNAWLAVRYDSTHVQLILESSQGAPSDFQALYGMLAPTDPQTATLPNRPTAQCEPLCFPLISWKGAAAFDRYWRQHSSEASLPPLVKSGDAFSIEIGNGSTVTAAVSQMLGTWGTDGFFLGALATVAPRDLAAFHMTSAKAFVAVRTGINLQSSLAVETHTASAAERKSIAALLLQHRDGYIAEARHALVSFGLHEFPQNPAQAFRLERLQHGEGILNTEITPVKLASGESRYYVRAEWLVRGKATFAVAAWIAVAPKPRVLWWDTEEAARCLIGGEIALDAPGSGMSRFPELINAATLPDGHTGLVLLAWGYESFSLNLDLFSDAGPVTTSVTEYGDGG